jgi:hypothetical protein
MHRKKLRPEGYYKDACYPIPKGASRCRGCFSTAPPHVVFIFAGIKKRLYLHLKYK